MIFVICPRTLRVCIFAIKLCHDFTSNLSRKSREISCLTISGNYLVNRLVETQLYGYIPYPDSQIIIDGQTNPI